MKFGTLFQVSPLGLENFVRVENTEKFVNAFERLYASKDETLYSYSRIFPFAYLNLGRLQLYLNKDFENGRSGIIPVVKKFEQRLLDKVNEQRPHYEIHSPYCSEVKLMDTVLKLDKLSATPVIITDLTYKEACYWENTLTAFNWKKVKTSDDIIQDAEALAKLSGRNYSSLRNTLKHVREDLKPQTFQLNVMNCVDALKVFEAWKEKQGKKYFRVTIGRDLRLFQEYASRVDFVNYFGYVHYINNEPQAASFGCRSWLSPEWGIDVTCKANIECKGLGDYAFVHLCSEMNKQGIKLVNDSGGTGNVKLNKLKFRPVNTIQMYSLVRK